MCSGSKRHREAPPPEITCASQARGGGPPRARNVADSVSAAARCAPGPSRRSGCRPSRSKRPLSPGHAAPGRHDLRPGSRGPGSRAPQAASGPPAPASRSAPRRGSSKRETTVSHHALLGSDPGGHEGGDWLMAGKKVDQDVGVGHDQRQEFRRAAASLRSRSPSARERVPFRASAFLRRAALAASALR